MNFRVKLILKIGEKMEKLFEIANNKNFKILLNTKWLLKNSMRNNMNASDIIVKLLAIEQYFGKNNFGMKLYNKMQKIRVSENKHIEREKANNQEKFISLINSFKKNGFWDKYPVELNKRFEIFEGSHRLACSLYFKISEIPVTFNTNLWDLEYDYSLEWFKKNNLTEYINVIKERYKNLF